MSDEPTKAELALERQLLALTNEHNGALEMIVSLMKRQAIVCLALIEACNLLDDLADGVPGSVDWAERVDELRSTAGEP